MKSGMRANKAPIWCLLSLGLLVSGGFGMLLRPAPAALEITQAARGWLKTLSSQERDRCLYPYDAAERVKWHFIPMAERKGLKLADMSPATREATITLLKVVLSELGYKKAQAITELESLLDKMEQGKPNRNVRDPLRYYVTLFGEPDNEHAWGLSFEGHHLSLNFTIDGERLTSHTPQFLGVNPAEVRWQGSGSTQAKGARVLSAEEDAGFALIRGLTAEQQALAWVAKEAPHDVAAAGEPHPLNQPGVGISFTKLTPTQQTELQALVRLCGEVVRPDVAEADLQAIAASGWEQVYFAWKGALQPGVGHYFLVEGPTFQIEFCNNQPDAEGNPANHIHLQWRDPRGDFGLQRK